MVASAIQESASQSVGSFLLNLKELFCACSTRSNLCSAKEKLKIVSVRGGAAHVCPATPEPRGARRGNAVRAIFKIHRIEKHTPHDCCTVIVVRVFLICVNRTGGGILRAESNYTKHHTLMKKSLMRPAIVDGQLHGSRHKTNDPEGERNRNRLLSSYTAKKSNFRMFIHFSKEGSFFCFFWRSMYGFLKNTGIP